MEPEDEPEAENGEEEEPEGEEAEGEEGSIDPTPNLPIKVRDRLSPEREGDLIVVYFVDFQNLREGVGGLFIVCK